MVYHASVAPPQPASTKAPAHQPQNVGNRSTVSDQNTASAADLAINHKEMHEARQERGEISKQGAHVGEHNMSTSDLGLRRDEIHEARQVLDAVQVG